MPPLCRRSYLASAGTALTAALAGCSDPLADGEEFVPPEYTSWIAESVGERSHTVSVTTTFPSVFWEDADDPEAQFGLHPERVDREITITERTDMDNGVDPDAVLVRVVTGAFDKETVADGLASEYGQLERSGEYGEYRLYGENESIGVRDGAVVTAPTAEQVEATIDAKEGETPRYVNVDDEFTSLVEAVGTGFWTYLQYDPREREDDAPESYMRGLRRNVTEDTAEERHVGFFESTDDASEYADTSRERFDDRYDDLTVERDGRIVVIKGSRPLEDVYPRLADSE